MERLATYFKPDEYSLKLSISRKDEYIAGKVLVYGHVLNEKVIKLHAVDMEILNIKYAPLSETGYQTKPDSTMQDKYGWQSCEFEYDNETIVIPITEKMYAELYDPGAIASSNEAFGQESDYLPEAQFEIEFKTGLNHNMQGCYISTYNYNDKVQKLIATQFESHYAREAFPCIDEPGAKARFALEITIPDLDADDVVLANTPAVEQKGNKISFARTPRMSTYLLAWVIGPLKSISTVNKHGVKVTSYCALNQSVSSLEFANEVAARALDYYDDKFGIKYPLEKLDQVALPDFEAGAMENWGLVTYRESCMLAEPEASVDTKSSVAVTVTHELSHQWFGNLVTMDWWDDLWLNESFATIMEYYAADALYPELKIWQDFFTGDCVAALRRDCLRGVQAVKQAVHDPAEIATLFDGAIVYAKGARLILMLIRLMGEEKFLQGVHDYFDRHKYQNAVGDDLWKALQPYADFDVKEFMHEWISQPGYPALQELHNGNKAWYEQQRFFIDGTTDDQKWPLPEVKDDMSGHYLIDLSSAEFQQKLDNFNDLSMEQKLRLLIDRSLLAKARDVPTDSLVDVLPKFVNEDVSTWSILLDIINDLKIFFPSETEEEDIYRNFLRHIIYGRVREVGLRSQSDDSSDEKRLRNILVVVARFARDEEIIQRLADQYQDDLSQIDAELRGNILMAEMYLHESEVFSKLLQKYINETDPEIKDDILGTLAAAREEKNVDKLLELLEQPEIVRPQDHYFLYIYMLRNPRARNRAINWLYAHWDYIRKMNGDKNLEYYPSGTANYINTEAAAEQYNKFFEPKKSDPALKRSIEMAQVNISARLGLIAAESGAVQQKVKFELEKLEKK